MISLEELQLAARNHGLPLEALQQPITPTGLHYLLIHYDIPFVDAGSWTDRVRLVNASYHGTWELPFGPNRALFRSTNPVARRIAGGARGFDMRRTSCSG